MNKEINYIEIRPDYVESGIKAEFNGYLDIGVLPFEEEIKERILSFNQKYKKIIPMGEKMRIAHMNLIYELDKEGFNLKLDLEKEYNIKVKYFSEGLMKYMFEFPSAEDYKEGKSFSSKILRLIEIFLGK